MRHLLCNLSRHSLPHWRPNLSPVGSGHFGIANHTRQLSSQINTVNFDLKRTTGPTTISANFLPGHTNLLSRTFTNVNTVRISPLFWNSAGVTIGGRRNLSTSSSSSSSAVAASDVDILDLTSDTAANFDSLLLDQSTSTAAAATAALTDGAALEASVASLHIASNWTPMGWCVHWLDLMHTALPWWGAIALGTLILRTSVFPLVLIAQRSASKLQDSMPRQLELKQAIDAARARGDHVELNRLAAETKEHFIKHNPLKTLLPSFAQIPLFLTFFLTLREMAAAPVPSLHTGGFGWITDLAVPDPHYALPVITSLTLWITLEAAFRSSMQPEQMKVFRFIARGVPLVTLWFTYDFAAAILVYWCTNNVISMGQMFALRQPSVRTALNLPPLKKNQTMGITSL